ncbi:MAG: MATE family efflux transporter [Clostridia bacterium]|nr:MATE family efflux transporter [Clostridia bacterium]
MFIIKHKSAQSGGAPHRKAQRDLTQGPILPQLVSYCLPLMLTGMLQLFYNATDMIVVGQYSSPTAVGAVGACGSLIGLLVNMFIGLSVGVSVSVAQHIGAKQEKDVSEVVHTSVALALALGVAVSAFGYFFAETALRLMDTPASTIAEAVPYAKAYMLGIPAAMMYNYCAAVLRAKGDTVRPLLFLGFSGLVNVGLNLWLVISFGLGAQGVGIATAVSQYVAMAMILVYMTFVLKDYTRIQWRHVRLHKQKLIRILRIGLPAGVQSIVFSFSNVLIQSTVNTFGENVVNGNAAAASIDGFIYTAQNSVYQAAITFVGQHVGARKFERINRVVFWCMGLVTAIGLGVAALVVLFSHFLLNIYVPGDEAAIAWGTQRLRVMGACYFTCGLMEVGCGALRGMGKTLTPMLVSMAGVCGIRILWLYTAFPLFPTMMCLYLSYPASWVATGAVQLLLAFINKRRLERQDALCREVY